MGASGSSSGEPSSGEHSPGEHTPQEAAGASEHSHSQKNRWSLIWKQEGTVPTRREMGAHRRRCHSHPHGIFEKGYCSNLRNHLPWAFPPVAAPPLHSFRVSSPGPQLIHTLEPISICVLFFWRCLSVFDGVEEQEAAAFSFGGGIKHSA